MCAVSMTQTPPKPAPTTAPIDPPPNAPTKAKKPLERHVAWSDMVDEMQPMPVEQARQLDPRDIGVRMGPIMDEHQFREYCKTRNRKVRIVKGG